MRTCVSGLNGRPFTRALLSVLALTGATSAASAQTTVTLNQPSSQVLSATVRGGSYANTNQEWALETRASDDLEYNRRALLKFDTENTIPKGTAITSALMTVTVQEWQRGRVPHDWRVPDVAVVDRERGDLEAAPERRQLADAWRRLRIEAGLRDRGQHRRHEGHLRRHAPREGGRRRPAWAPRAIRAWR